MPAVPSTSLESSAETSDGKWLKTDHFCSVSVSAGDLGRLDLNSVLLTTQVTHFQQSMQAPKTRPFLQEGPEVSPSMG